jgi:hypothetical protein
VYTWVHIFSSYFLVSVSTCWTNRLLYNNFSHPKR